jgi:hypothetical protein
VTRPGVRRGATVAAAACSLVLSPAVARPQRAARCERGTHAAARAAVATTAVAGNGALYVYFKRAWWSGERAPHWFVRSDWDGDFRDQDKLGHLLGGYQLTRIGGDLLRASCVSDRKAALGGALYAAAFQLQIEIWDGFQQEYGFSPADLLANTAGAGLALAQWRWPALRHVKPTFSYAPTAALRNAGATSELRPTVDYSGQTYWLSADVEALLPERARPLWPSALRLSVGHSITDWVDPVTQREQRARRKIVVSLDLDPERLPGENPLWKRVKHELSYYHFPAPALQLAPTARGIAWYR